MAKKKEKAESTVRQIRRKTRKKYSAEDKIRIVIEGLRGEMSIAELCRQEGSVGACTTNGAKSFLKLASSVWPETQSGKPTAVK